MGMAPPNLSFTVERTEGCVAAMEESLKQGATIDDADGLSVRPPPPPFSPAATCFFFRVTEHAPPLTPPPTLPRGALVQMVTGLHWSTMRGYSRATEWLLAEGANVDKEDQVRWSPQLTTQSLPPSQRSRTRAYTHRRRRRLVLQHARTALIIAATTGRASIARLLLEKGADTNRRDKQGKTALDWATSFGSITQNVQRRQIAAMIRNSRAGWTPATHGECSAEVRRAILAALLALCRLGCVGYDDGGRCRAIEEKGGSTSTGLPPMPPEMCEAIFRMLARC